LTPQIPKKPEGEPPEDADDLLPRIAPGYRRLMEQSPAVTRLRRLDPEASTVYISPQIEEITGYSPLEWTGEPDLWIRVLHPEDRDRMQAANARHVRDGEPISEEYRVIARDGHVVWLREESSVVRSRLGKPIGSQGIMLKITGQHEAEQELRLSNEIRRSLVQRLASAEENERARLADDIHDDPVQLLTASHMRIEAMIRKDGPVDREALREIGSTLQEAIGRLRRLVFELAPPKLATDGLAAVLRVVLRDMQKVSGIEWSIEDHIQDMPFDEVHAISYRIVREALSNVRTHARARHVVVQLESRDSGILVTVRDDGVGFQPTVVRAQPGHLGLHTMRERAELAGGWCRVTSKPGAGTVVTSWLPLRL
jgi:PAS domain S-box-containing protein